MRVPSVCYSILDDGEEVTGPDEAGPELAGLDQAGGDHAGLEEARLEEARPEEARPEEARPEEARPEEARPEEARPEEARWEEARWEEARPEEARPEEARPEEARPEEARPEEARPEQVRANPFANRRSTHKKRLVRILQERQAAWKKPTLEFVPELDDHLYDGAGAVPDHSFPLPNAFVLFSGDPNTTSRPIGMHTEFTTLDRYGHIPTTPPDDPPRRTARSFDFTASSSSSTNLCIKTATCPDAYFFMQQPQPLAAPVDTFRLVIVGAPVSGKTSLMHRQIFNRFDPLYEPTILDCYRVPFALDASIHELLIHDTSGRTDWRPLRNMSLRYTDGYVLVFAADSRDSFLEAKRNHDEICRMLDVATIPCVLVATKCELLPWYGAADEIRAFARATAMPFRLTSALYDVGIGEVFAMAVEVIQRHRAAALVRPPVGRWERVRMWWLAIVRRTRNAAQTPFN